MRIVAILTLCVILVACKSPSAEPVPTKDAKESDPIVEIRLCDELDWELPDGRTIRTELRSVCKVFSVDLFESNLHLTFSGDGFYKEYQLEDNGPMPPNYLYPCNITGSGRDLFVSKETTSLGIEIWTYELFSLDDKNDLVSIYDYRKDALKPQIPVRKESMENSIKIYAEATEWNEEILLIDYPMPVIDGDRMGYDISGMDEGKSIAMLERHQETVPEDIDGDGKDELRCQYYMGLYREWYSHVTAWFSYTDGEWETVKLLFESYDKDESIRIVYQIPAREIISSFTLTDENAYTTDDPALFEVKGLRVGSPVWEIYERLGDPYGLYGYTYRYAVDDGTRLLIETEGNRIARFTLTRP